MPTLDTIVTRFDHYGNETEMNFIAWEDYFLNSFAGYIGRCIQAGDIVDFSGDVFQGSIGVSDGLETVYSAYWMTEDKEIYSDEELAEMHLNEILENY